MTKSEQKREIASRLLMVESFRAAKARTHEIFGSFEKRVGCG